MTPEARVQAAIEMLAEIADTPRPADGAANDYLRARRYIGAKDRREISERVWGVLRRRARLDWLLAEAGFRAGTSVTVARARVLADLCFDKGIKDGGKRLQTLEAMFDGQQQHGPSRLSDGERHLVKALCARPFDDAAMPAAVLAELPDWLHARMAARFGDAAVDELAALRDEAPVDLRVNTLKTTREAALLALEAEGVRAVPTRLSPLGLRLTGRANLAATQAFKDGLVEVQDEGSQLAAALVDAKPGETVCDFCAGAGGKTLALAAMMENKGRLIACDVSEGRSRRAKVRIKRAGAFNVTPRVIATEGDKWIKRHAKAFDRVLVDAPCSGSGTWRRNPDAKWRLTEDGLAQLAAKQADILETAARLVKPGGRLVYVTCSLLPEENEVQVTAFTAHHADFSVIPVAGLWKTVSDTPPPTGEPWLRLTPARHGTDGFFVAVLERAKA